MGLKIINISGLSSISCKCETWLQHWVKYGGGTLPNCCPEYGCTKTDLVAAYVQKISNFDTRSYIVPLCSKHNKKEDVIELVKHTRLVSVNRSKTCGKILGENEADYSSEKLKNCFLIKTSQ